MTKFHVQKFLVNQALLMTNGKALKLQTSCHILIETANGPAFLWPVRWKKEKWIKPGKDYDIILPNSLSTVRCSLMYSLIAWMMVQKGARILENSA